MTGECIWLGREEKKSVQGARGGGKGIMYDGRREIFRRVGNDSNEGGTRREGGRVPEKVEKEQQGEGGIA